MTAEEAWDYHEKNWYQFCLPDVCIAFRMSDNGGSDPLDPELRAGTLAMLKARLEDWKPSLLNENSEFDECVRRMIEITVNGAAKK